MTPEQLRDDGWRLLKEFAKLSANARPPWQTATDLALSRTAPAAGRILALGALANFYPDQSALILLRVVTTRGDNIGVRIFAGLALATSESITAEHALVRAINDGATEQSIVRGAAAIARLNDAGAPNDLRAMICKLAADSEPGRRALRRIWRSPDQFLVGWPAVAISLLVNADDDNLLVEAATMAAMPAYGQRGRVQVLQVLYTLHTQRRRTSFYPDAYWNAMRQIWSRDTGDLRYAAGEILKLQARRQN